jgi:hypothetical protein
LVAPQKSPLVTWPLTSVSLTTLNCVSESPLALSFSLKIKLASVMAESSYS